MRFYLAQILIANYDVYFPTGPWPVTNAILYEYPDRRLSIAPYDFDRTCLVSCPAGQNGCFSEYRPSHCQVIESYESDYNHLSNELLDWFPLREQILSGYSRDEIEAAFLRVAPTFISKRDQLVEIANNQFLGPEWRELMLRHFNAYLDALQSTLNNLSADGSGSGGGG